MIEGESQQPARAFSSILYIDDIDEEGRKEEEEKKKV
jgi:hypothetical protein